MAPALSPGDVSGSCSLSEIEVAIEPFHLHLLSLLTPSHHQTPTVTPSHRERLTLHYVTSSQLKDLLATQKGSEHDVSNLSSERDSNLSSERASNSKSDSEESVISILGTELGSLLESTDSIHSDLIPGVYEGGMKIWECAYDLVDYLASNEDTIPLCGSSRILELGCGVGLPGMVPLLCGAGAVHFHDYNREVLNCLTIPSVLSSFISGQPGLKSGQTGKTGIVNDLASKTKFFYGDWADFVTRHCNSGESPYDIILTSETIYSESSQPKLLEALKKLTNQNTGLVVMAAKVHYFGVGGSVAMFRDLVTSDGHFEISVAKTTAASVSRVILLLRPKKNFEV